MGSDSCGGVGVKDYRSGAVSVNFSSQVDSSASISRQNGTNSFYLCIFLESILILFFLNRIIVYYKIEFVFVYMANVNCIVSQSCVYIFVY